MMKTRAQVRIKLEDVICFEKVDREKNCTKKIIQEYVGHSTISTTANLYLHPDIEAKKKAVSVIANALSA